MITTIIEAIQKGAEAMLYCTLAGCLVEVGAAVAKMIALHKN